MARVPASWIVMCAGLAALASIMTSHARQDAVFGPAAATALFTACIVAALVWPVAIRALRLSR